MHGCLFVCLSTKTSYVLYVMLPQRDDIPFLESFAFIVQWELAVKFDAIKMAVMLVAEWSTGSNVTSREDVVSGPVLSNEMAI